MIKKKEMTIEDLAVKIDGLVTQADMSAKIDASIDTLAIKIEEGFMATAKQEGLLALGERVTAIEGHLTGHDKEFRGMHGNFEIVFQELKAIRERLDSIEKSDTSTEVLALDMRVRKLEKKAKLD